MKKRLNTIAAFVFAGVLLCIGIYQAAEYQRLKRSCTSEIWGTVTRVRYINRSGYRADVEFSVNDRTYNFYTGRSIRRIGEENLIVRYDPDDPHDCYSQDYSPSSGLLWIFIAAVFAVMGVLEIQKKTSQE